MTEIQTRYFGTVPVDAGLTIEFPLGLPAFEREHRFLAIEHPKASPLVLLQSFSTVNLCFLAVPVGAIDSAYRLQISAEDLNTLGIEKSEEPPDPSALAVLALVVIGNDGGISANLMAPIVVNRENRRAVQAVRWDGAYAHNHPVALTGAPGAEERSCS